VDSVLLALDTDEPGGLDRPNQYGGAEVNLNNDIVPKISKDKKKKLKRQTTSEDVE
jgi:hypothetical protein